MVRLADWEQRLHGYLTGLAGRGFTWGRLDCALFAAGAVMAITGEDPAAAFRGRYRTARGSVRALRRFGAGTLEATIAAQFEDRPAAFARRGDLALVAGELGPMVGVVIGADALFIGDDGFERRPRADWSRCWSVG